MPWRRSEKSRNWPRPWRRRMNQLLSFTTFVTTEGNLNAGHTPPTRESNPRLVIYSHIYFIHKKKEYISITAFARKFHDRHDHGAQPLTCVESRARKGGAGEGKVLKRASLDFEQIYLKS